MSHAGVMKLAPRRPLVEAAEAAVQSQMKAASVDAVPYSK